jgi:hypothetical protein
MSPTLTQAQADALLRFAESCERVVSAHAARADAMTGCVRDCRDCAELCRAAASMSARGSPWAAELLPVLTRLASHCSQALRHFCDDAGLDCADACDRFLAEFPGQ